MRHSLHGAEAAYSAGANELAPGIWAWLQPNGSWGESNAGLVRGAAAAALIDTLWDRRLTRRMLSTLLPRVGEARLKWAINTHSDGDHWWGNGELPADVEVLTSSASLAAMQKEASPEALSRQRALAALNARLPVATPAGLGLLGRYVAEMLAPFDFGSVGKPRLPDRAFADGERLQLGERELQLIEVGPAHTEGDAIVHIADAGIVFAADILFVGSTPVMWSGPIRGWLQALERLLSLDAEIYVPGHGPICGRREVQALREYLQWVEQRVADQHSVGLAAAETVIALTRDPEFERWRSWLCPERLAITAAAEHRALSGQGPISAGVVSRTRLFTRVAELRQHLQRAR